MALPVPQLSLAAGAPDEVADPLARIAHVASALDVRADAGDADELRQLVEPGAIHGRAV